MMITVLSDFNTRVKEIEIYFKFLEDIINDKPKLHFKSKNRSKAIDEELIKILKANGFLLLYNLIEASIKKSIEQIYFSVTNEKASYKDVREEIKIKWIEIKYKNFKNNGSKQIFDIIDKLANDIIEMDFDSKKTISGNIDARKIREFAENHGFSYKTHKSAKDGNKLYTVRNQRNDLAHGVVSFSECGKDFTIQDLLETKKEVIVFLRGILKNIEKYILKKKYLLT